MADNFRAISAKQSQGGAIDQATFDQIQSFINQISVAVKGALQTDLDHAQETYNRSIADVEACDTTRCEELANITRDETADADQAKIDFDNCKAQELIEYNNMTTHCNNVNNLVNGWNGNHCTVPDFSLGDTAAVETYMICICDFVETHKEDYYDKRQKCIDATTVHGNQVTDCHMDQGYMGNEFCDEQHAIQTMCHDYTQCRIREEGEHSTTVTMIENWEDVMQAQRVALEQLICFGNHILDNDTNLDGCQDTVHTDCLSYTDCPVVIYHSYAARMVCVEPAASRLPCQAAYTNYVCGAYPPAHNTECLSCHACGLVAYPFTEAAMGPANCV